MAAPITAYSLSNGQEPISYDELRFLEQLCDLLPDEPLVVNIGAADGLSTITFLSKRPRALVYSVDCEPCPQELENVSRAGLEVGRVIRMLGRSEELGRHFPFTADFLFVDGGHFNAGNDCAAWLCHVKPGGIVAFHDYMEKPPPQQSGERVRRHPALHSGSGAHRARLPAHRRVAERRGMKVQLVDGCFYASGRRSASLGDANTGLGPQHFEWTTEPTGGPTFFTDMCLEQAEFLKERPNTRIAWLIEPPWKQSHYRYVIEFQVEFDYVLSYVRDLPVRNLLYYPHGGSLIALDNWGVYDKTAMVSLIASNKRTAPGHLMRHAATGWMALDVWGSGYRPIESLVPALVTQSRLALWPSARS